MKITNLSIVITTGVCAMLTACMLAPALAPWLARESIFEFTAREPRTGILPNSTLPEWRPYPVAWHLGSHRGAAIVTLIVFACHETKQVARLSFHDYGAFRFGHPLGWPGVSSFLAGAASCGRFRTTTPTCLSFGSGFADWSAASSPFSPFPLADAVVQKGLRALDLRAELASLKPRWCHTRIERRPEVGHHQDRGRRRGTARVCFDGGSAAGNPIRNRSPRKRSGSGKGKRVVRDRDITDGQRDYVKNHPPQEHFCV